MEYLMTEEELRSAWETCTCRNYAQMDVICQGADDDRDYREDDYYRRSIYRVLRCHSCLSVIVLRYTTRGNELQEGDAAELGDWGDYHHWTREILLSGQRHVDNLVPEHIATDYREAAAIVHLSPKASAALSRRCLQAILLEAGGVPPQDLSKQIDAVLPKLPPDIAESIDAVRNIGNFAAHPTKDKNSGQIIAVEPGEAEWNLDVLDMLFDFYYVRPQVSKQRRDTLNARLAAAGKPPMKQGAD
jgi:hypothetical protein